MESYFNGIQGVVEYIDDILVTTKATEGHLKALNKVLSRLEKAGLCNMSTVFAPLYRLLRWSTSWRWGCVDHQAFEASKQLLTSAQLLDHYDPELEVKFLHSNTQDRPSFSICGYFTSVLERVRDKTNGLLTAIWHSMQ